MERRTGMTGGPFGAMEQGDAPRVATADPQGTEFMRRLIFVVTATALGAFVLAGCDDYQAAPEDSYAPQVEEQAEAAEDSAEPVVAPEVTDPAPTPAPTPSPEEQTSEQSVQPESETLFY